MDFTAGGPFLWPKYDWLIGRLEFAYVFREGTNTTKGSSVVAYQTNWASTSINMS